MTTIIVEERVVASGHPVRVIRNPGTALLGAGGWPSS
jgi:hypothetical protein